MNEVERQLTDVLRDKATAVEMRADLDGLEERRRLGATGADSASSAPAGSKSVPAKPVALALLVAVVVIVVGAGYTIATRGDSPSPAEASGDGSESDPENEGGSLGTGEQLTKSDIPPGPETNVEGEPPGAMCVLRFSPETLRTRAFAFDGTVLKVSLGPVQGADAGGGHFGVRAVFEVHQWFTGGADDTVEVLMQRDVSPGQRLLVSGQPRWGGNPLDDPIAWECGFTTLYSQPTAEDWAAAWSDS